MSKENIEILHDKDIKFKFKKYLENCDKEVLIISAFAKIEVIKWIDSCIDSRVKKRVLLRFQKSDILSGATDFEIIDYCLKHDWILKFDIKLHSKIYLFNNESFIIGSANATNKGLAFSGSYNKETAVAGNLDLEESNKINRLFDSANDFSQKLIEKMSMEIINENNEKSKYRDWSKEILEGLSSSKISTLFKEDLLTSSSPKLVTDEDIKLLELKKNELQIEFNSIIKEKFVESKFYQWLKIELSDMPEQVIYFGELSKRLHSVIILNDKVFRVDIKNALANLLNWIQELEIAEIIIDRPNYSQRIRLIV
ncbi:phospholipase D-like domain-containing protein [Planococcus kocurii]|uniref:phospholipase D-like domain-containing protein n=1 Tax=Planococcus kocurii TaxID=1374 RepID=UPI003CFBDDB5